MRAIVLLNMGGASSLEEVSVFLRNMFKDKAILPIKSAILRNIISLFITKKRTPYSQENYKKIGSKSPILDLSKSLQKKIEALGTRTLIAMRYTPPFALDLRQTIKDENIKELVLLAMYPQYSTTTTQSSILDVLRSTSGLNLHIKIASSFYNDPRYIKIIRSIIAQNTSQIDTSQYEIIFSAHGLPQSVIDKGDDYLEHTKIMFELLRTSLEQNNILFNGYHLAFQSRFGRQKWLSPYLSSMLKRLQNKNVIIMPISFTIDNLETLYELDIEYRQQALKLGIKNYHVLPCPNDSDEFASFLNTLASEA